MSIEVTVAKKKTAPKKKALPKAIPALPTDVLFRVDKSELVSWLDETKASDWQGELDYNDLKEIAGASESGHWMLALVPVAAVGDWEAGTRPVNRNPIVWLPEHDEVLDGKHRVGAANARGEEWIWAFIPAPKPQ